MVRTLHVLILACNEWYIIILDISQKDELLFDDPFISAQRNLNLNAS